MKTLKLTNRINMLAPIQAIMIALLLYISPVLAWASPEINEDRNTMTQPFDLTTADLEGDLNLDEELNLEEWMTQPFELSAAAELDEELNLEEWMSQPFGLYSTDLEEELVIEDWMIRAF